MSNNGGVGKRIGASIGAYLLYAVIGIIIIAVISGGENLLHQNTSLFQGGESLDLNEYIASGKELPMGEFVHLDLKGVLGQYASSTTSNETRYGAKFKSGVDYYYLAILEDFRVISVITSSPDDVAALDGLADALNDYDGEQSIFDSADFPSHTVTGKLTTLTDKEAIDYYQQAASSAGINVSPFDVTMIVLDTTAVRTEKVLLYVGLPIALIVIAIILFSRRAKKRRQEELEYQRRMAERSETGL